MRIIGEIAHPFLKITVFKMDDKVQIKFEHAGAEIAFKIKGHELVYNFETAKTWVDQSLLTHVEKQFKELNKGANEAFKRRYEANQPDNFDTIL